MVAGATSWKHVADSKRAPAPASVADVVLVDVIVIVLSAVVVPALILLRVKIALAVAWVESNTFVPARLAGTVMANAIGMFTSAPAAGLPLNGNEIGSCCTSLGSTA